MRTVDEIMRELSVILGDDVTLELKRNGAWVLIKGLAEKKSRSVVKLTMVHKALLPLFYNDTKSVVEFVQKIGGCADVCVCDVLNSYIKDNKVSIKGAKRRMHAILQHYGLYKGKYSTFAEHVD